MKLRNFGQRKSQLIQNRTEKTFFFYRKCLGLNIWFLVLFCFVSCFREGRKPTCPYYNSKLLKQSMRLVYCFPITYAVKSIRSY